MAAGFLKLADDIRGGSCNLNDEKLGEIRKIFEEAYEIMQKSGYEFAYRSVKEIRQYISSAYELDRETFDSGNRLVEAVDEELLQKVLPKVHGNRKEIDELLDELIALCENYGLNHSLIKIKRMKGKLAQAQYASFI